MTTLQRGQEAWATDPTARALRVELTSDHAFLLPFDQFVYAEIRSQGADQSVRAVFATHELLITGYALRRVIHALQRSELSQVTLLPECLREGLPDGHPVIHSIEIKEVKPTQESNPEP